MRTIKTRNTVKGIKVLDRPANLSKRMKDSLVRTKEKAEETREPRHATPTEYASDNITSTTQGAARETVHHVPNPVRKARDNLDRARGHFQEVKRQTPKERQRAAEQAQKTAQQTKTKAETLKKTADQAKETANEAKTAVKDAKQTLKKTRMEGRQKLREVKQSAKSGTKPNAPTTESRTADTPRIKGKPAQAANAPKTENPIKRYFIKNRAKARANNARLNAKSGGKLSNPTTGTAPARSGAAAQKTPSVTGGKPVGTTTGVPKGEVLRPGYLNKGVTSAKSAGNTAKTSGKAVKSTKKGLKATAKGSIKTAKKSIKTAEKSAKVAVKTAKQTAKAAQKSAVAAAKAAKAAAHAAKVAAKVAAVTAKAVVKATIAMVKLTIAAIKGLVALIAAGGWIAVVIILVICLIALLVGSIFGIFFSGEDTGTGYSMPAVVSELSSEFYDKIEDIKSANPHDILDLPPMSINWPEVLAVYAVRVNTDPDNPAEIVTLDEDKINRLRDVLNDMVSLSHHFSYHTEERTVIDEDGEETVVEVIITTLHITMSQKSAVEMAAQYGFNQEQNDMLAELLSPEYSDLWAMLLGGYVMGNGEILIGNINRIPNNILSWPVVADWPVSSGFGNRSDPFTGETRFHGGIDIAAPEGTPILAAAAGTVTVANGSDSWGGGFGYYVKIQHENGFATLYAHCVRIAVVQHQEVAKGEVIAYVGSTGRSTGNHLHWEVHKDGVRVNPLIYFG